MTAIYTNQIPLSKESRRWLDIFMWLYIMTLLILSIVYAQERIIAYDTSLYLSNVIHKRSFHVETNRFISFVPQILPFIGIKIGSSLTGIILLYSLNFTLLPILCALFCRYKLNDSSTALAILLFYTMMNARIFYYPVSELQGGLILLLLYSSLFRFWIEHKTHWFKITVLSTPIIITIVFSHPLSIVAFGGLIIWMILFKETRKWHLLIPIVIAAVTHVIKQNFFRAISGGFDYEQDKKNNLNKFLNPISTYFDSPLAKTSWKEYTDHYFMIFVLIIFVIIVLITKKRWLATIAFSGIIFSFWLLVTVTFQDSSYTFYHEHMYQPVGFFIAVGLGYALSNSNLNTALKMVLLLSTAIVSFSKVIAGHKHNSSKINFYKPYIDYMRANHITKAALPRQFVPGNFDSYWAGEWESMLISGQDGPDSAIILYLHYAPESLQEVDGEHGYDDSRYFRILKEQIPVSFDSIATRQQIDSLNRISKHNPDN